MNNHMLIVHKIQKCECKECGEYQNATVTIMRVWYIEHVQWIVKYAQLPIYTKLFQNAYQLS